MAFCAVFRLVLLLEIGLLLGYQEESIIYSTEVPKEADGVEFRTLIKEKGTRFEEKIKINIPKNTVIFNVPAHNDVDKSDVLYDFNSNLTITRLPKLGICHIKPLDLYWSPKPTKLQDDIIEVMTDKPKNQPRRGIISMSSEWAIDELLQPKDLGESVARFCNGHAVYSLRKMNEDDVIVEEQQSVNESGKKRKEKETIITNRRQKRRIILCGKSYPKVDCNSNKWLMNCTFVTNTCVYWVTCKKPIEEITMNGLNDCDKLHQWNSVLCCSPTCPT